MSSLPSDKFLPLATASESGESAPTSDANAGSKTTRLTQSSPPVLQTSESHVEKSHTRPTPPETAPTIPDNLYENYVEPQRNQLEEGTTSCCTIMDCYTNFVTKVRNSVFIYIVLLLFFSVPVSAIVMGVGFAEDCPKLHFLPVFGAVVGGLGAIFMAVWVYAVSTHLSGTPCSNRQIFLFGMLCFVVAVMTTVDAVFVYTLSPSSDPTSPEYCHQTFYNFAFYKEMATVVAMVLSVMLYLPGNRHIFYCTNCYMLSPPNAFYVSL